jgi:hypothetical protein
MLVQVLPTILALTTSPSLRPTALAHTRGAPLRIASRQPNVLLLAAEPEEPAAESALAALSTPQIAAAALGVALVATIATGTATPEQIISFPAAVLSSPILAKAGKKAIGGGLSGALAGVIQVLTLMWMRTTMNYQYRYGSSTREAMKALYEQGGIARFYQGVQFAILQTPLARFGDTAANTGVLELLALTSWGVNLPVGITTAMASAAGSLWRIGITPLDTLKTTLQVDGAAAYAQVVKKVQNEGPQVLYQGALANAVASFVGSYPWFYTFNLMMKILPAPPEGVLL